MSVQTKLDRSQIAQDFKTQMNGVMEAQEIAKVVEQITDDSMTAYPAKGNLVGALFYSHVIVELDQCGKFTGNAGGLFTPGGGWMCR